jgi:hypothetical protein
VDASNENDKEDVARSKVADAGLDERKPVLAYDRRLPKNAKNKQHLRECCAPAP